MLHRDKLNDIKFAYDITIIGDSVQAVQYILPWLDFDASKHGTLFASNMCMVHMQEDVLALHTSLKKFDPLITLNVRYKLMETFTRILLISKYVGGCLEFTNLQHL